MNITIKNAILKISNSVTWKEGFYGTTATSIDGLTSNTGYTTALLSYDTYKDKSVGFSGTNTMVVMYFDSDGNSLGNSAASVNLQQWTASSSGTGTTPSIPFKPSEHIAAVIASGMFDSSVDVGYIGIRLTGDLATAQAALVIS